MKAYFRITINGREYGRLYKNKQAAAEAARELSYAMNGVGWRRCEWTGQ
ncbi:hypothetical protein ACFSR7_12480 [Cohnella sp. GCM10020058]